MLDLHHIFAMQKKALFFLLALCALGWGFTPYQPVFAGIAVGAGFGTYNFWLLLRRMEKFDRSMSEGTKAPSLGSALRFGSGVAAVAVAISLPTYFHLESTVIGLMLPYVWMFFIQMIRAFKN